MQRSGENVGWSKRPASSDLRLQVWFRQTAKYRVMPRINYAVFGIRVHHTLNCLMDSGSKEMMKMDSTGFLFCDS